MSLAWYMRVSFGGIREFHFGTLVFALYFNFSISIVEIQTKIQTYFESLVSNNTRTRQLKTTLG